MWGDAEFVSPEDGRGGVERSIVGPFRYPMEGHVLGKGEDRKVVGAVQTEEGLLYVCFDGVWVVGGVRPGRRDECGTIGGGGYRTGRRRDDSKV